MKKIALFLATILLILTAVAPTMAAETRETRGFVKKDGTELTVTAIETTSRASAKMMVTEYDPEEEFDVLVIESEPLDQETIRSIGADELRMVGMVSEDGHLSILQVTSKDRTVYILHYSFDDVGDVDADMLAFLTSEIMLKGMNFKTPRGFSEVNMDEIEGAVPVASPVTVSPSTRNKKSEKVDEQKRSGDIVISGAGSTVTEDFYLEAGRYEATFTVSSGTCGIIYLYEPSDTKELLFNECVSTSNGFTASVVYKAPESGMYFIDSQNTENNWTVTFKER